MKEQHRQGDLLFEEVEVSDGAQIVEPAGRVLAEGERTGHMHEILPEDRCRVGFPAEGPRELRIDAIERIRIRHPQHGTTVLPRGKTFRMIRQRENIAGIVQNVRD